MPFLPIFFLPFAVIGFFLFSLTPFLKKIVKKHKGQTVLIVGHGGVNRVLMGILMGWDGKRITDVLSKNTAVNILHVREGKSRLHLFNCTKHLEM